ncbi:cobyric acid synthase CobQ [Enemella evansiae]|uniref:cobyric acid synthase n=1 Tax=Enemella evansiae TaxID=2016499 RepID=UPI000B96CAB0|nr:cobyric acid synthase [Enemella evansiae]OYN96793.1 cobyric acid synthase CobQ [Enemella evansiae]
MSGLLIAGTNSDAGKSLLVAGICRSLARKGIRVAPFKAQNMSNNSMVCLDPDGDAVEIGRAQWTQAVAAQVAPSSAMNPVLLKPGSDRRAFVVLRGRAAETLEAGDYATGRQHLAEAAFAAYEELSADFDVVICEGAGSPAEINLRRGDYVNLGLARRFGLPVSVVGDIDRGGLLAALYGTWALLEPADQKLLISFVVNRFRGDEAVLQPGLDEITARTGVPFAGVLPWLADVWIDSEDALRPDRWSEAAVRPGEGSLRVAVVRLPRVSNATDVEALAAEPGVEVLVTASPVTVLGADLVVLPGSRATVSDLGWLRERGLAEAIAERVRLGRPVLGICGGFQMFADTLDDPVESGAGLVPGLGLLPTRVTFTAEKTLGLPRGAWQGLEVAGYEIHHGSVTPVAEADPFPGGLRLGPLWGTMWHGCFESDAFRRAWLSRIAAESGSDWRPAAGVPGFAERRETMLNRVADAIDAHLDPGVLGLPA